MEKLLKDKEYFKFITGRSRLTGKFDRKTIQERYDQKEWLKQKVPLDQITEVMDQVEIMCSRFLVNRIVFLLYIICAFIAFSLFVIGIIINVQVTKSDSSVKVYNFWDLSWPYFSCFFFIPLIVLGLFFLNKHYLNKYERIISQHFADININIFEKLSVIWKVGEQCSYLDISQVSKLRSKSKEYSVNSFQKIEQQKRQDLESKPNVVQMQNYTENPYSINESNTDNSFQPKELNSHTNIRKEYDGGNPESFDNKDL